MEFIKFLSNRKTIYILAALCFLLLGVLFHLKGNLEILDTKFFYLKSEIQPIFTSMGEEGRTTYMKINMVDFCLIITYTLFFIGTYFAFFKQMAQMLIAIPVLLSTINIVETSTIYWLLRTFPQAHDGAEYLLMFVTPLKWILVLSSLLVFVNGYLVNLYMKKT
jgi:multisubunit Na+/H+ antiporter MnhC subunit